MQAQQIIECLKTYLASLAHRGHPVAPIIAHAYLSGLTFEQVAEGWVYPIYDGPEYWHKAGSDGLKGCQEILGRLGLGTLARRASALPPAQFMESMEFKEPLEFTNKQLLERAFGKIYKPSQIDGMTLFWDISSTLQERLFFATRMFCIDDGLLLREYLNLLIS